MAFTVEGQLTYKLLFVNPAAPLIIENRFRATVVGNRWLIELTPKATNANAGTKSILVGTDGTNVYEVFELNPAFNSRSAERTNFFNRYSEYLVAAGETNPVPALTLEPGEAGEGALKPPIDKKTKKAVTKPPWNEANAVVWPSVVPRTGRDFYDIIWLAFSSHDYLKSAKDKLPTVGIPHPGQSSRTNRVEKASWTVLSGAPRLPETVRFFNEGYRESRDGETDSSRLPPPFDQGYVKAQYMVYETTNVGRLVLPLTFSYQRFRPRAGASSNTEVDVASSWEGVVTLASALEGTADFVPEVVQTTAVADYRERIGPRSAAAAYAMKEGQPWKSREQVNQMPEVRLQREIERRRTPFMSTAMRIAVVIVFFNMALGAVLVVRWRARRLQQNKQIPNMNKPAL